MIWRALGILLLLPAVAWGQRGSLRQLRPADSHVAIPSSAEGMSATELLARKLGEAELSDYLKGLLKSNGVDATTAEDLLKNPFAADILKRLADGDPVLLKLAEQAAAGRPEFKGLSSDQIRLLLSDKAKGLINPDIRESDLRKSLELMQPNAVERERLARQAYNERITDLLREFKMEDMVNQLREAPAFQNWMEGLVKAGNQNVSPLTLGDTMHVFGGFDQWIRKIRPFIPSNLSALRRLDVSRTPSPTVHLPSFGFSRPSVSSFDLGGSWPTLVMLGAATAIVIVALMRLRLPARLPIVAAIRLGPWPVDPRRVKTRQELIAAFEYLALLKCGADAVHWHHRDVASRLSGDAVSRSDAKTLADLYEQARYTPLMAQSSANWESSRTPLCRLSGVGV
jgi:hypothetical protein